ncbi:uncharacterized protein TNCV_3748001 [Trichonephila clavipes]|nr:uncharacterized protein TNCV_3748001 [Trichonephila clavipes]
MKGYEGGSGPLWASLTLGGPQDLEKRRSSPFLRKVCQRLHDTKRLTMMITVSTNVSKEQMSRSVGQSEARPPMFKLPSKFGTHLSTHCSRDERLRGFGRAVPYKTLKEEEVEVEPVVTYNCDYCEYRSPTQKGLRCHRITVHRIGVGVRRTLDTHGRPLAYFG